MLMVRQDRSSECRQCPQCSPWRWSRNLQTLQLLEPGLKLELELLLLPESMWPEPVQTRQRPEQELQLEQQVVERGRRSDPEREFQLLLS